jgi:large subunit ribosomal protein L7/L12
MPIRLTMVLVLLCGLLSCRQEPTSSTVDRSATYAVVITTLDRDWKIRAIKTVREETGLGLADAKELVEKLPATVKDGLTAAEAEALIKKLEASGMKAEARK